MLDFAIKFEVCAREGGNYIKVLLEEHTQSKISISLFIYVIDQHTHWKPLEE